MPPGHMPPATHLIIPHSFWILRSSPSRVCRRRCHSLLEAGPQSIADAVPPLLLRRGASSLDEQASSP